MSEFEMVAIAIVTIASAARLTRLVVWDSYPPAAWVRMKWDTITKDGPWSTLVHCGYCFSPWAALFVIGWGYISEWHVPWWLFNGWLAAAYFAAIMMAFDGDDGDED